MQRSTWVSHPTQRDGTRVLATMYDDTSAAWEVHPTLSPLAERVTRNHHWRRLYQWMFFRVMEPWMYWTCYCHNADTESKWLCRMGRSFCFCLNWGIAQWDTLSITTIQKKSSLCVYNPHTPHICKVLKKENANFSLNFYFIISVIHFQHQTIFTTISLEHSHLHSIFRLHIFHL